MSDQKTMWLTSMSFDFPQSIGVEIRVEDNNLQIIQGDDRVYIEMPAAAEFARQMLALIEVTAARGESQ